MSFVLNYTKIKNLPRIHFIGNVNLARTNFSGIAEWPNGFYYFVIAGKIVDKTAFDLYFDGVLAQAYLQQNSDITLTY